MAIKLRLKRMGAKRAPFYRIVAADSRSPRDGRFIEIVGTYNPVAKGEQVTLKEELVMKWLRNGAQPTDTVRDIFSQAGIMKQLNDEKAAKKAKPAKKAEKATKEEKPAKTEKVTKEEKPAKTEKTTKTAAKKPAKAKKETKEA